MIKQLTESITAQDATLTDLSVKTNSGGGGEGGQNTEKKNRGQAFKYARTARNKYITRR